MHEYRDVVCYFCSTFLPRHSHGGTWRVRDDGLKLSAMRWASTRESPTYQLPDPGLTG